MLPELIQAACTMFGAWGPAIANTTGSLYQLRALDWNTDGPFQQYPAVVVYHPNSDNGHDFAIVTWIGFIGAITGYSSAPIGLSEKVWMHYNGTDSRSGIPFHFLLRDILQYDGGIDDAITRIINADRTCSIFIGLGDTLINEFRAIEYSLDIVRMFDDANYPEYPAHPRMPGLVYIDKHTQPSNDPCLSSLLTKFYGNITPQITKEYITAELQTGDTHIAIYDYKQNYMYIANASPYNPNTGFIPAYNSPFVRLDMLQLFAESL